MEGKQHAAAMEHYTAALAASVVDGEPAAPPAVIAVLHCNRAAAYQALDQMAEALADCGRARALNPAYAKVGFQIPASSLAPCLCTAIGSRIAALLCPRNRTSCLPQRDLADVANSDSRSMLVFGGRPTEQCNAAPCQLCVLKTRSRLLCRRTRA